MTDESRTLTWLHIGDFHIDRRPYDQDVVLRELVSAIRTQREVFGRKPDVIFVTGDEAQSGQRAQYSKVTTFLDDLRDAAQVPKEYIFVIPGNHDVDRLKGSVLPRTLTTVQDSHRFFESSSRLAPYMGKLKAWRNWHDRYFKDIRRLAKNTTCEPPVIIAINGITIAIAQINSSLFCQDDFDERKLWIGRVCLDPVITKVSKSNADIRIALMHHPTNWLHDEERSNIEVMLRKTFDVILHGHLHEPASINISTVTDSTLHLVCGATYQGSEWPNRVNYATADFEANTVSIYPMAYYDRPYTIWTIDPNVFPYSTGQVGVLPVGWIARPTNLPDSRSRTVGQPVDTSSVDVAQVHWNLSIARTRFFGRKKEITSLVQTFTMPDVKLLTLTGAGGCGKTRLALKVAEQVSGAYTDGTILVQLGQLSNPNVSLVWQAVLDAMSILGKPSLTPKEQVLDELRYKHILIVMDACEHVISYSRQVIDIVLNLCPRVDIIATTRIDLNVEGQRLHTVAPLETPSGRHSMSAEEAMHIESVQLLVDRIQSWGDDFSLSDVNLQNVIRICRQLEGIPFAIELAAARTKTMSLGAIAAGVGKYLQILDRGSSVASRHHQTLRGLIDWSFDLLTTDEQRLLVELSIMAGGWTSDAAREICVIDDIRPLDTLLDHSMVFASTGRETNGTRYQMLDVIREYGAEKLLLHDRAALTALQERHFNWCCTFSEGANDGLVGFDPKVWIERLRPEHENLRAALRFAASRHIDGERGAHVWRLASIIAQFSDLQGYYGEGRELLQLILDASEQEVDSVDLAQVQMWAGILSFDQGDYLESEKFYSAALRIMRCVGDQKGIASVLSELGRIYHRRGDYHLAKTHFAECLEIRQQRGDTKGVAETTNHLASSSYFQGDYSLAIEMYMESLKIRRATRDVRGTAWVLNGLANAECMVGELDQAELNYQESMKIRQSLDEDGGIASVFRGLAHVAIRRRKFDVAKMHADDAMSIWQRLDDRQGIANCFHCLGQVAFYQRDLVTAEQCFREASSRRRELGDQDGLATSVEWSARTAYLNGKWMAAILLWREVLVSWKRLSEQSIDVVEDQRLEEWAGGDYIVARIGFLDALCGIASVKYESDDAEAAIQIYAAATAIREIIVGRIPTGVELAMVKLPDSVQTLLSDEGYDGLWEGGRNLTIDEAVRLALD